MNEPLVSMVDTEFSRHGDENRNRLLASIRFDVYDNDLITIVGPNGCGKTTLLRIIADDLDATEGKVSNPPIYAEKWNTLRVRRQAIGFMRQQPQLFPWLTVERNVLFGPYCAAEPRSRREETWTQLDDLLQLNMLRGRHPHQLSGGEQQRVALAQVLATRPQLLLLDEPFSALDPNAKEDLQGAILRLHEERAVAMIHVTHDIAEAVKLANRILVLGPTAEGGTGIVAQLEVGEREMITPLDIARIQRAIAALFTHKPDSVLKLADVLATEAALKVADRVYIIADDIEREYQHPEENPFLKVVAENLKKGVLYSYILPGTTDAKGAVSQDAIPHGIQQFITSLATATGLGASALANRLQIWVAPRSAIHQSIGDCAIVEHDGEVSGGWYFPVAFNYDLVFALSDDRLEHTWGTLKSWAAGFGPAKRLKISNALCKDAM